MGSCLQRRGESDDVEVDVLRIDRDVPALYRIRRVLTGQKETGEESDTHIDTRHNAHAHGLLFARAVCA